MNIQDIFGAGKILPVDKLIDLFAKSVGKLSKPYFDRKDIETKSYEIKKLAEARAEEMKIMRRALIENSDPAILAEYKSEKISITQSSFKEGENATSSLASLNESAQSRAEIQNIKAQLNLESIAAFAAEELKHEAPVSEEPVSEDWANRFFKYAEDISNEEMQALWGKILAGEIKSPKTYSLRTLELLRNLSKEEADIFVKAAGLAIGDAGAGNYFIYKGDTDDTLEKFGLSYSDRARLIEIGLLQPGDLTSINFMQQSIASNEALICGNIIIVITRNPGAPAFGIGVNVFTKAGIELLSLVKQTPVFEYLKLLAQSFIKQPSTIAKYGYILVRQGNTFRHTQPLQDF